MDKRRSITIKDIAKLAGVSHSTVSRALNDNPMINIHTRQRIKKIATEHQFEFNAAARSLSIRKTGVIAVIYKSNLDVFGSSLYTNQLFLDLRHSLEHHQLDAILLEAFNPKTGESNISRLIRQNKVDGFLLIHSDIPEEDYKLIKDHNLPMVQLHLKSSVWSQNDLDTFMTDNVRGGFLAAEHLLKKGCNSIITLSVSEDQNEEYLLRTNGFRMALKESGYDLNDVSVFHTDCSYDSGYKFVMENRDLLSRVDALFIQADILAFGCISALKELGVTVPGDIRIIGFDDTPVCTMIEPQITTIHQPRENLSHQACNRISDLVQGKEKGEVMQVLLEPELVVRDSA